jgi:hypothetical protein
MPKKVKKMQLMKIRLNELTKALRRKITRESHRRSQISQEAKKQETDEERRQKYLTTEEAKKMAQFLIRQ